MTARTVHEVTREGIALLRIDNPPLNALDEPTMRAIERCVGEVARDRAVRALVITGAGAQFVVGADVQQVLEVNTRERGRELTARAQEIVSGIGELRKPVIAAINGLCLGGGTELALACHLRIAGEQAQLGLPEVLLGIMPGFGGTQRLPRLVGSARALEIMLTGRFVPAAEAERIGLVNRVVPQASLLEEAMFLAQQLAARAPLAVEAIIDSVMRGSGLPLEAGLRLESERWGMLAESRDKAEGITAFLEKRRPAFRGE